ncbi:lytic transglycosylase domain-containing protein [Candidatus Sulfurimonas baltica]|uniref:Lytic transglycosylase domain-containing protein n=1 Tax=Candidatus Sulfurimonas baltica TaxID=2740404 RepID=A0A7S7RPB2_9BACT|nr:lytic transglycosylase domain-containing protein [Candidatus Sulfurimonas baltica]QOY53295.1 lytic transglycosylase domain-containing protein [Candidatus Sulfurimonas baltica]
MIKHFLVFSLVFTSAYAKITLEDIESKPASRAKDFMIWQYLKQNINSNEADKAYQQVNNKKNSKLLYAYAKKTKNQEIKKEISCKKRSDLFRIRDTECLELAFSPYKALNFTNYQRDILAKRLKSEPKAKVLNILNEKHSTANYKSYDANTILTLFNNTGYRYRRKYLNISLDKEFLDSLTSSWRISQFIKTVIHDDKLDKLQQSLFYIDGEKLNSKSNFFLALNSLRHSEIDSAVRYFELSRSQAKHKIDVDKNNFWLYKITKDKDYLNKLLLSMDINIYTLYAREKMSVDFKNYFTSLKTNSEVSKKSLLDPFEWDKILKEIRNTEKDELLNLVELYKQKEMLPVQALIIQKANQYNIHGYVMPYDKHLEGLSLDSKALVYALMRQESNMIPSALSRSYALGLMQIMPFVTDDISKRIREPIKNYDEMFMPENNIRYSRAHIKWMQKSLYHPLFLAYAYNGGMGFFKKHLLKGSFSEGEYEPFLSMEMMSNGESREYGKRVLANYVMYKKVMGEEISIAHLFDILTQPKMTDRFRKQG